MNNIASTMAMASKALEAFSTYKRFSLANAVHEVKELKDMTVEALADDTTAYELCDIYEKAQAVAESKFFDHPLLYSTVALIFDVYNYEVYENAWWYEENERKKCKSALEEAFEKYTIQLLEEKERRYHRDEL